MGKKNKSKKNKHKKGKSSLKNDENNINVKNSDISEKHGENKFKLSKKFLHKKKEMKRKIKRFYKQKKKNEKNKEIDLRYFDGFEDFLMEQEDLDKLPHDKFTPYIIPTTIKENKEYIPKLISESNIILELLDARDVYHSKNETIEDIINLLDEKLLIYVITKCDLVSEEYINKIKNYLETKNDNKNPIIITSSLIREKIQNFFNELQEQIKLFQEKNKEKNVIKIGIIGSPNIGKNSLIQSLELFVDVNCEEKYIYFNKEKNFCVNSVPGIIFDEDENNNFLISKLYKNINEIDEPIKLINNLLDVVNKNVLKDIYELKKIPETLDEFIILLKERYEFRDNKTAVLKILNDIITGKIYYEVNI